LNGSSADCVIAINRPLSNSTVIPSPFWRVAASSAAAPAAGRAKDSGDVASAAVTDFAAGDATDGATDSCTNTRFSSLDRDFANVLDNT
jgi:hypothetical protein